jgi:hypothetical protein
MEVRDFVHLSLLSVADGVRQARLEPKYLKNPKASEIRRGDAEHLSVTVRFDLAVTPDSQIAGADAGNIVVVAVAHSETKKIEQAYAASSRPQFKVPIEIPSVR